MPPLLGADAGHATAPLPSHRRLEPRRREEGWAPVEREGVWASSEPAKEGSSCGRRCRRAGTIGGAGGRSGGEQEGRTAPPRGREGGPGLRAAGRRHRRGGEGSSATYVVAGVRRGEMGSEGLKDEYIYMWDGGRDLV
jgi:hypothetical protein